MMVFHFTPEEIEVVKLSYQVAGMSLLVNVIPSIAIGWLLARKDFWGKSLIETLVFLPLVLPPVVPGYIMLVLFGNQGLIGKYLAAIGFELAFNWKGAVLAAAVMGLPLMVQSVRLAIELVDKDLETTAMSLGSTRLQTFVQVTLPLARTGILIGAILSFCRSLGEFGATITFVGNIEGETRTLPLAIYSLLQQPDSDSQILRLMSLSIGMAFLALWLSQWYSRHQKRKLG